MSIWRSININITGESSVYMYVYQVYNYVCRKKKYFTYNEEYLHKYSTCRLFMKITAKIRVKSFCFHSYSPHDQNWLQFGIRSQLFNAALTKTKHSDGLEATRVDRRGEVSLWGKPHSITRCRVRLPQGVVLL